MMQPNSRIYLEQLLAEMIEQPARQAEIARVIEDVFGQNKAVLVLDMSGFCRTARDHSIVMVLSMIYQMRELLKPCVEAEGGQLIKAEADNLFCLFDTVGDALGGCRQIQNSLMEVNRQMAEHCRLNVSMGIGYGRILNIEDKDIFGEEVNLASKLGEDIAGKGEILLTKNAFLQLQETESCVREETVEISGFSLRYHIVQGLLL
ncbi:MAG TPA: adenylate/guanylate cyclase domain-containing protein [Pyrinomonadaceae bacterium]|jgi:class 3 adenylate cyclase